MIIAVIMGIALIICPVVPRKYFRWFGLAVSIALAYCAFHVDAYKASDLYRHFQDIELYRVAGYDLLVEDLAEMKNPLVHILLYLFSFIDDSRWFPAIIIFVVYQLIFSLINKVAEDEDLTQNQVTACTAFVLINFSFYFVIYAIKMWVVFAVFAYTLYVETARKKNVVLCWGIYFALIFFHYAALFLLLARLIAFFIMNPPTTVVRLFSSVIMFIGVMVVAYYLFGSSLGESMQDKFESYLSYNTRGTWQTIECWMRAIAVFCLAIYQLLQIKEPKNKCASLVAVILFLIMIIMMNNYQITLRFPDGLVLLSVPMLAAFMKPHKSEFYYPVWQLIFIGTTIVQAVYILAFDFRNLYFNF